MKDNVKQIVMIQPAGIGDILITQKLACDLHKHYDVPVKWPVYDHLLYLKDYLDTPVQFLPWCGGLWPGESNVDLNALRSPKVIDETLFVPIWRAFDGGPSILKAKYNMVCGSLDGWQNSVKIKRKLIDKEAPLIKQVCPPGRPYVFVNRNFATPPGQMLSSFVKTNFEQSVVNLRIINEYTPFDWLGVMQNALEIHMVSSCHLFMLEALPDLGVPLYIYNRQTPDDWKELEHLKLRKSWNIVH